MENIKQKFKNLYDYESWNQKTETMNSTPLIRPFSLFLKPEDEFERVNQTVSSAQWGESMYTQRIELKKNDVLFSVTISPYHTDEKAKKGMLIRMISSVPFQKAEDISISDLCYTHPLFPKSYLLFLSHRTLVEIMVPKGGDNMEEIKVLAKTIIGQMKGLRIKKHNYV